MREYIAENKNCFQCCLAGLFNLELGQVPDISEFASDAKDKTGYWFDSFYEWCKDRLDHIPVVILEENLDDSLDDIFHIVVYENAKHITHSVIYKGQKERWDPALGANRPAEILPIYRLIFVPIAMPGGIKHDEP